MSSLCPSSINSTNRRASTAIAIQDTTNWLDELLKLTTPQGRRVISPATEASVRALLDMYQRAADAPPEERTHLTQTETLATIRNELGRRLDADQKYAEARWKLEKLEEEAWLLKYGDYYATSLSGIRQEARSIVKRAAKARKAARRTAKREVKKAHGETKASRKAAKKAEALKAVMTDDGEVPGERTAIIDEATPGVAIDQITNYETTDEKITNKLKKHGPEELAMWSFLGQPWIKVDQTLSEEEELAAKTPYTKVPTPMGDLIRTLTSQIPGLSYDNVRVYISLYAQRNLMAHGQHGMLATEGRFHELATMLKDDLMSLNLERTMTSSARRATKAAITETIGMYFEMFKYDELTGTLFSWKPWPQTPDGTFIRTSAMSPPSSTGGDVVPGSGEEDSGDDSDGTTIVRA